MTTVRQVSFVAPAARAIDGTVEIVRDAPAGETPVTIRRFTILGVMLETADGWKIRLLRASGLPDPHEEP